MKKGTKRPLLSSYPWYPWYPWFLAQSRVPPGWLSIFPLSAFPFSLLSRFVWRLADSTHPPDLSPDGFVAFRDEDILV